MRALIIAFALALSATAAYAYPQYQLSREQTCTACHFAPTGGGLLNDNGQLTDEDDAKWGGDARFLHGAVETPEWLHLGGDVRFAAGASNPGGGIGPAAFPMQLELHAQADKGPLSVVADLGVGIPREGEPLNAITSRQHYLEWMQHPGDEGWYGRIGRYMPIFGLRFAEHPAYTRRFGGTPLFGEGYAATLGWVGAAGEFHLTGFSRDRLRDSIEDADGVAVYAEKRFGTKSIGAEARYADGDEDKRTHGGIVGKVWLDGPALLFQAEAQVIHQTLDAGSSRNQLVAYLMTTWFPHKSYMLDVGVGHYDEDLHIAKVDRDALEANLHWFPKAHVELVLMGRLQMIGLGGGGPNSGYGLLQLHYRL